MYLLAFVVQLYDPDTTCRLSNTANLLCSILCLILVNNQEAQAYINPGSGSYIFQTVIGGILAIIALFKKLFMSLLNLFGIKKSSAEDEAEDEYV